MVPIILIGAKCVDQIDLIKASNNICYISLTFETGFRLRTRALRATRAFVSNTFEQYER